jgi:phosphopantothenoylcysteine decarboxylase/phosphopantothenate--cysteine ligase
MDGGMLDHPATQENLGRLAQRGAVIAGPAEGRLASGLSGKGRMLEPAELVGHIRIVLGREGRLAGRKIVVSAGGTQEPVDPVRILSNRSSGKQGYAVAQAALDAGGHVVLISAPTPLPAPIGATLVPVNTAEEMLNAVVQASEGADALIMAAAVADFRPKQAAAHKLKSRDGVPQMQLEATEDVLKAVGKGRRPRVVVGFAAESRDLTTNAVEKLKSKKLDLIVANDISAIDAGFGTDTNRVTILDAAGNAEALPLTTKTEVAEIIIERVATLLE